MKYFLSIILSLLIFAGNGQNNDSFYKHLEGKVNNNIYMIADLIRTGEQVEGTYYYFYATGDIDDSGMYYGKTMPLSGNIGDGSTITFTEFNMDGKSAAYHGVLIDGNRIEGTWRNADGTKELPFVLTEKYPEGSIPFDVYHHVSEFPLLEEGDSPVAKLEQTLLLPVYEGNEAINDSVTKAIEKCFFGKFVKEGPPKEMMKQEEDVYFTNYRNANTDIYDGGSTFSWEKKKIIKIHFNQDHFLSFECFDYGFTGGAHGLPMSKFIVIDLEDGHRLTLDEIFRPDYRNDLRDLINNQLRVSHDLTPGTPLKEAGFFVQELEPTDNFYVNKDGLGFYYNRYEVAPYAMGHTDVFVPMDKLERFLASDSPLRRLKKEE